MLTLRDIRCKVGQLIITGFDGYEIPVELRSVSRQFDLAGIILFGRNVDGPEQVYELSRQAQSMASDLPLWVSVDQEGGRVARLNPPYWRPLPAAAAFGDLARSDQAKRLWCKRQQQGKHQRCGDGDQERKKDRFGWITH